MERNWQHMTRLTLTIVLTLAVLLLCGSPSQIEAQSDTKIIIRDGGSILLRADGLDAGNTWSFSRNEVRHHNLRGVLHTLAITEAGVDRCGGSATCGVNPARPWRIHITYGSGSLTVSSLSANRGVHITHNGLPFDQWQRTANTDEREFGHGDGRRITGLTVNGGANLCSGHGCVVTVQYTPQ